MQFEHPGWLVLLVLLVPVLWWSRGARVSLGPVRGIVIPLLRCLLIVLLVCALADPVLSRHSDRQTVAIVLDRSRSMDQSGLDAAVRWLQDSTSNRSESEYLAVVDAGRDATAVMMPDATGVVSLGAMNGSFDATDLGGAIEFAKGLLPDGGTHRILLVSDGNETAGSLLDAAENAGDAGIPIDVLPVSYVRTGEVMVERIVAPREVKVGESVPLRVVMRSAGPARGRLLMLRDGIPISDGLDISLDGGASVIPVTLPATTGQTQRFEAYFEPAAGSSDAIDSNNQAAAISLVSGRGRVLLVAESTDRSTPLAEQLSLHGADVHQAGVEAIVGGPAALAVWDAIVLVDLPRWAVPDHVDGELAQWVRDGGGGLMVTGGPTALGAGGWIGSSLASVLPVGLDPPAERQVRRGALALVLHSCEMPRGNYWGRRVAESAIETLSSVDYVGIVEYDNSKGRATWALSMQIAEDKAAAMRAAASLKYGDMPSFESSMQLALKGLEGVDAGQRHMVVISDGDPQPPSTELLQQCFDGGITVTTVMVGGHGTPTDRRRMSAIATMTGGRFYDVTSPSQLPQIFIQEAQVVSRSLLQTGSVQPGWGGPPGGPLPADMMAGLGNLPAIDGYVLTEPLGGLAVDGMTIPSESQSDPLYAWWFHGLGRVVVFTSDVNGAWTQNWVTWSGASTLWKRTVAWLLRPGDDERYVLNLREGNDGEVVVELDAADGGAGFSNFLQTNASVLGPGGVAAPLPMRQVGPGRYQGTFTMTDAGGWVVAVRHRGADPETGELIEGWVQGAAVRNWPAEDAAIKSNDALLHEAAARSGGRVLSTGDDPTEVVIFERAGLVNASSRRSTWAILALFAAALLILDVAVRRIVPDAQRREVLARRAAEGRVIAEVSAVAAWKRVRAAAKRGPAMQKTASPPASQTKQINEPDGDPKAAEDSEAASTLERLREVRRRLRDKDGAP
ncbi:MAG: VWA domain-containing protein [Planctomycetes bacterium]|nr:VWA domain-containing protein [Planctomycetota bacterium]